MKLGMKVRMVRLLPPELGVLSGPVNDNVEFQNLLQSLEDESYLDSTDDGNAVDTVEQCQECSDAEQDIYTDEDESGDES